uniref:hypothetical protein n=1 Tax=Amycolatopsis sp. CA-096443 TaxID=3239919 RepID=UPI003F497B59
MSALGAFVRALARLLPSDERDAIGVELSVRRPLPEPDEAGPDDGDAPAVAEETPLDWNREWNALSGAVVYADRAARLLEDQAAFFDYGDLARAARALQEQIGEGYELMCQAPRLDGMDLGRGDGLDAVRRAVGLRRAEIVDAELAPLQPAPAEGTATWTIDYDDRGGFVAVSDRPADGAEPWKFWGTAPTATSAAHALAWFFLDRPPRIRLRAPEQPRPWAEAGWQSERPEDGPGLPDLLALRGPAYEQHLAACRTAQRTLREHADDIEGFLAARAADLNAREPQLRGASGLRPIDTGANRDHRGSAHTVAWVPSRLVVGTVHSRWGEFGEHRPGTPLDIAAGLLHATDLDAFTATLFAPDISLLRVPAWAGPLYRIGSNGTHRAHTARMLGLPLLAASVQCEATPPAWHLAGLIAADRDTGEERAGSLDRRIDERTRAVEGLLRRGVIDGSLRDDGTRPVLHCTRLPASWLLRDPRYAARANGVYESRYPGALARLGVPPGIGADPAAWTRWLTAR